MGVQNKMPWNQAQIDFILANYTKLYKEQICEEVNKIGPFHSMGSVKAFYKKNNLKSGLKYHFKKGSENLGNKMPWNQEQIDFVLANYTKLNKKQLCEEVNKIGPFHSVGSVKAFFLKYHLKSGIDCQFKKGIIPPNAGKKLTGEQYAKMSKTFFKKGQIPHNLAEIGTEVQVREGYIKVKIGNPNIWRFKHHIEWEKHNGPIPKGYKITFLDGNRGNWHIENLRLVSHADLQRLNLLFDGSNSPEEREVQIDIVQITGKISSLKKSKKEQ